MWLTLSAYLFASGVIAYFTGLWLQHCGEACPPVDDRDTLTDALRDQTPF